MSIYRERLGDSILGAEDGLALELTLGALEALQGELLEVLRPQTVS